MSWYAAHLIVYFKRRKGPQKRFLVWENIVLIRAKSSDEAYEKAEQLGREEDAVDDATLRIGGHPSRLVFAGVRKVTLCQDEDSRPNDGSEVSYNEWGVRSEAAIKKLVAGKTVAVEILDPFPDEDVLTAHEQASRPRKTGS
jgi:Domain of unknown function (DUF4288)